MALKKFSIKNIGDLDGGRIAMMIDQQLGVAEVDCQNRPGVDKPRKVIVEIELHPIVDESGVCEEVSVGFDAKTNVPKQRSKQISMGLHASSGLMHNPASEHDVRQGSLDDQ